MNKLTLSDQFFIRDHYAEMTDAEMAQVLKTKPWYIHQYRVQRGFLRKGPNDLRRFEPGKMDGRVFNVNEIVNWLT